MSLVAALPIPVVPKDTETAEAAPLLSVVMPVHNEEAVLAEVIEEAISALEASAISHELVLLDDASTDGSASILDTFQRRHSQVVRVLRHETNRGIIATCEDLYAAARGRFVFVNASDGQWQCAEVTRMLPLLDSYDVIVGRRRRKHYGFRRRLISGLFNLLPLLAFGVRTYDAGSIKLFRREILRIPLLSCSPFREAERIIRAQKTWLPYRRYRCRSSPSSRRTGQRSTLAVDRPFRPRSRGLLLGFVDRAKRQAEDMVPPHDATTHAHGSDVP